MVSFFVDGKFYQLWITYGPDEWNRTCEDLIWSSSDSFLLTPLSPLQCVLLPVMCTPKRLSQNKIKSSEVPLQLFPTSSHAVWWRWPYVRSPEDGGSGEKAGRRVCSEYGVICLIMNVFCCWCQTQSPQLHSGDSDLTRHVSTSAGWGWRCPFSARTKNASVA